MKRFSPHEDWVAPKRRFFYTDIFHILKSENLPFLVGGAYALWSHTRIARQTKDLDLFVKQSDCRRILDALENQGYRTELTDSVWLAKCFCAEDFIDLIFRSGNGMAAVDDDWFLNSQPAEIFGIEVQVCAPEEMIWSKSFTMEKDRYDGADIAHLILVCSGQIDWSRLVHRFGEQWRVLLSHLILFGFIYPSERHLIPKPILSGLLDRLTEETEQPSSNDRICNGTLLSRLQYVPDTDFWKFGDARFSLPIGFSREEIAAWKQDIQRQKERHNIEVA